MNAFGRSSSHLLTLPFLVAVAILGSAALLSGPFASWKDYRRHKLSLPLKHPLPDLDTAALAPYRVIREIELAPPIVEALGTEQYAIWELEDDSVPSNDPLRLASLSVTYYSATEQLVLHTPDVCALGAGYQPAQPHEYMTIELDDPLRRGDGPGNVPISIPIRVCTFLKTAIFGGQKNSIVYVFHCNGRFVASANRVRLMINDPRNRYAYFSKVEVSFPRADRAACARGARKLFARALPILLRDHWPDFEAAESSDENTLAGAP